MKLFLASEAKHPKSLKKLEEYVGGLKGKTIAYIPTSANGEKWQCWRKGKTWDLVQKLDAKITLVQLEDYTNRDPADDLMGKDIIWFAGGYTGYLLYWMRLRGLDKKIKNILENGPIYVGSSSGSMITGNDITFAEWLIGDNEPGAGCIPGLGLVDFNFYPHYEEKYYEKIKEKYKGNKMYLVKDGEVIVVDDGKINVLGEERLLTK